MKKSESHIEWFVHRTVQADVTQLILSNLLNDGWKIEQTSVTYTENGQIEYILSKRVPNE